ncbi:unnamed protein product [Phaedon cochleariae]|uniref:aralkylamine N-acetyltransferase n=1 Tax=Phaedon cochleariae TaxID=80249 RepID=A0A9N9X3V2_PHACE|nr:unnamed protein product [Phaedon cochleariae]
MSSDSFDYDIRIAKTEDRDAIAQFLRTYFYKDEPLNKFLEIVSEENPINHDLEAFAMADFDNGISLMAFRQGKLIAVCLNFILHRGKKEHFHCEDEKFSKIVGMLEYVEEKSDPFQKYPGCDKAVSVGIVSVDDSCRGKGVAKKLIEKTGELGKQNGCGFLVVDCSSHFTACAVKKLGFEMIYSLDYADYKVNGEVVLCPEPPHKAVTVYTKKID